MEKILVVRIVAVDQVALARAEPDALADQHDLLAARLLGQDDVVVIDLQHFVVHARAPSFKPSPVKADRARRPAAARHLQVFGEELFDGLGGFGLPLAVDGDGDLVVLLDAPAPSARRGACRRPTCRSPRWWSRRGRTRCT